MMPLGTMIEPRHRSRREPGRLRVVLLGLGAINAHVADLLRMRQAPVAIVGVITKQKTSAGGMIDGLPHVADTGGLAALLPDLIIEAATSDAVAEWGEAALRAARQFVVSSASAFADDALLTRLRRTARRHGSQLVLSPGALAGTEALAAATRLGVDRVEHRITKAPRSWGDSAPAAGEAIILFRGSAREAASAYPLNANVTVVSAMSGIGLDRTIVELVSDPSITANRHELAAAGAFGSLRIIVENEPLTSNPRSSKLAALSLVRLIENQVMDIVL